MFYEYDQGKYVNTNSIHSLTRKCWLRILSTGHKRKSIEEGKLLNFNKNKN